MAMNNTQRSLIFREAFERRLRLSEGKSRDYANSEDVLKNFRERHALFAVLDIQPAERECDVYLSDVILKLQRICNLLHSGRKPENEAVSDSLDDAENYLDLLRCYLEDQWSEK